MSYTGFADFGKQSVANNIPKRRFQGAAESAGNGETVGAPARNRFAAFANAEVAATKKINDEIKTILSEDEACSSEGGPKFAQIDLARILSKVLNSMNLLSENADSLPENQLDLLGQNKMYELMVSELGKSLNQLTEHNGALNEANQKLREERKIAVQARDDMVKMMEDFEPARQKFEDAARKRREFFDEGYIIDLALKEFREQEKERVSKRYVPNESNQEKNCGNSRLGDMEAEPTIENDEDAVRHAADMTVIIKKINNTDIVDHNEINLIHKTSTKLPSFAAENWDRALVEASSVEEKLKIWKKKEVEFKRMFDLCLNILGVEQRRYRKLRSKALKMEKQLIKRDQSKEKKKPSSDKSSLVHEKPLNVTEVDYVIPEQFSSKAYIPAATGIIGNESSIFQTL